MLEFLVQTRGRPALRTVFLLLTPLQTRNKRDAILCHAAQFVFRRRKFLRFATDEECLVVPGSTYSTHGHAIHLKADCESIRLELHPSHSVGAFGAITIQLATALAGRTVSRLSIPLPLQSAGTSLPILDHLAPTLNTRRLAPLSIGAQFRRQTLELRIPRSALPTYDQLWVKCERRFGFFDEAGWIALEDEESGD